jgi:hypothetical protein
MEVVDEEEKEENVMEDDGADYVQVLFEQRTSNGRLPPPLSEIIVLENEDQEQDQGEEIQNIDPNDKVKHEGENDGSKYEDDDDEENDDVDDDEDEDGDDGDASGDEDEASSEEEEECEEGNKGNDLRGLIINLYIYRNIYIPYFS